MIRFLNDETVAGHRFGKGAIARLTQQRRRSLLPWRMRKIIR